MKLKSILKTLNVEQLQRIENVWGISPAAIASLRNDAEKASHLVHSLYQRLQNRALWERVFGQLSPEESNLVKFLAIHGGDLEVGELTARFFDGNKLNMLKMVARLSDHGIVFFDQPSGLREALTLVGVPEPFLRYLELPSFWEGYLGFFLKDSPETDLKAILSQGLQVVPEINHRNYLIHLIRKHLLDPKYLRRYLDRVPPGAAAVLQLLLERKGACVYRDLLELNVQRRYDHSRGDAIQWLLVNSGILFTAITGLNKYNNLLMIPRDVAWVMASNFEPDVRTFRELDTVTLITKEDAPSVILDNSANVLRDLVVLCNYVDRTSVRELATGGIGKNDLKKVMPLMSRHKTLKYAEFLALFAIQKKLLVSTGDIYRVSNTFLTWLDDAPGAYADIISWWLKATEWNEEFIEGNTIHVEPAPTGLASIVAFRRSVLEVLNEMPRDRWCLFRGLIEESLPRVEQEVPGRGEPMPYDRHTRSNELVIESIVGECLHWLGIFQIGLKSEKDADYLGSRAGEGKQARAKTSRAGRPKKSNEVEFTFRFTDLGRAVFQNHPEHWHQMFQEEDENAAKPIRYDVDHFIVQPNLEAIVPPDLKLRTFYHLTEIATIKTLDVMSIFAINKESLRAGLDRGLRGEEIMDFLRRGSRTPIPDSLAHLIRECADKHGEVNMGFAGGYIVIDDPMLLEQVKANRKIAPNLKEIIDNRFVLLNADVDVRRLARELQKIGFMPRLSSEHVHMKDDDLYHLSLTREDMYTLIAAVRFTMDCKDERGQAVAEERLSPLLERLKPDPRTFIALNDLAEPLLRTWTKASDNALQNQLDELKQKYESQFDKLVSTAVPRGISKHNFKGPNPAIEAEDIEELLTFAIEHEFEIEIEYVKSSRDEVTETVAPESMERERLLGRCRTRNDAFSVYKIDRITKARLL